VVIEAIAVWIFSKEFHGVSRFINDVVLTLVKSFEDG